MTELQQIIVDGNYTLKDDISMEARDLLSRLLEVDPDKRINVAEILRHPWMTDALEAHQVELFTEQEKQYIKAEFTYGKTSRFARNSVLVGLNGDPTD